MQALNAASDRDTIQAILRSSEDDVAPGCAVAIFRGDASEFFFSGFADIAAGLRPDADTLYYAGSLAKQFTALAVVQEVIAGRLDLDDDVRRHLPEMPYRSTPITIGMLLHHTSGLPNYAKLGPLAGARSPSDLKRDDILRMLLDYPESAFPPGATFEYSNGGYLLLSAIVERVSGEAFASYVRNHILAPLGMRRTAILEGSLPRDANQARGYMPDEGAFRLSEDVPTFGGAGAIVLTLNDLARYFHDIQAGGRVWTPEVTRLMTTPGIYADGSPVILPVPEHIFGYAGGLQLGPDWVHHGGNFAGFQAWFGWLPHKSFGLAILCNRGDVDPLKLAARIVPAVAPELPTPDAQRFVLAGPAGRFVSDTLGAIYRIEARSDDVLNVTITPSADAAPAKLAFRRTADGAFACGPITLIFDHDRRGFCVRNENVSVRYRRTI